MDRTRTKNSSAEAGRLVLGGAPILSQSFRIGFLNIRYYSLTFVGAILAAYIIGRYRAVRDGIRAEVYDDIVFWTVLVGFVCARIYYVLFYWSQYQNNLSEIYKVWHGGLAIYGGLLGGIAAIYFTTKKYKIRFFHFTDLVIFALPVAQAIGRIGNFLNYEAFGRPTDAPWKMFVPEQFRPAGYAQYQYFTPTFAYEIVWNLIVLAALFVIYKLSRHNSYLRKRGILTGAYLVLYSIGRYVIEGIRLDSAYFGGFSGIRGDQITALLLIIVGLGIIVSRYVPQSNQ